jgi:3-keto-disaccharide hydrolase
MRIHQWLAGLFLIPALALSPTSSAADKEETVPEGFKALFNGTDLKGWKVYGGNMAVWGAEKGVIYCDKGGGGWLLFEEEVGDFELHLQFKLSKGSNSGVALRTPASIKVKDKDVFPDPAYHGMEIQLIDDPNWKDLKEWQHTGAIYNVVPPAKQVNKPFGEWNTMTIVCKGPKVKIQVNGETLVDANLDEYKEKHSKAHPGILREKGRIGFQSYNTRVEFRNVFLKAL